MSTAAHMLRAGPTDWLTRGLILASLAGAPTGCDDETDGIVLPPIDSVSVSLEPVAQGLNSPVFLTAPPGDMDRLFVVEQGGRIEIIRDGAVLPMPFLNIARLVSDGGEQGLLGLAFHPAYATNGHFFVNYTDTLGDTRIVRYAVSANADVADSLSAFPILTVNQPDTNHNGGMIAFGPDSMLYIGMGDGGGGGDPGGNGQDRTTLLGDMLRIDVDGGSPYAIPDDNPFAGGLSAREEIWASGLRNPWRFSFDRNTGDLYIGDVGQSAREEVSFQPASSGGGENYGWNIMEGSICYPSGNSCSRNGLTLPIHDYGPDGCAITGGYVYRGSAFPDLAGRYFFADFCSSWLRSFRVVGGVAVGLAEHSSTAGPLVNTSSFGEDAAGELYVVSLSGTVHRIVSP